jgi:hypothetical protein
MSITKREAREMEYEEARQREYDDERDRHFDFEQMVGLLVSLRGFLLMAIERGQVGRACRQLFANKVADIDRVLRAIGRMPPPFGFID